MNKFLKILDKPTEDDLLERIEKENISNKYGIFFAVSLVALCVASISNILISINNLETPPAIAYSVKKVNNEYSVQNAQIIPVTLPSGYNTFKNVVSWLKDAINESYTFSFINYEERLKSVEKYFTPEGYVSYLKAIEQSGVLNELKNKKIEITILSLKDPIMINNGFYQDIEFWTFKGPVLVSYYAGGKPVNIKYTVEVVVKKVPSYMNEKSLAIHEYSLSK